MSELKAIKQQLYRELSTARTPCEYAAARERYWLVSRAVTRRQIREAK